MREKHLVSIVLTTNSAVPPRGQYAARMMTSSNGASGAVCIWTFDVSEAFPNFVVSS